MSAQQVLEDVFALFVEEVLIPTSSLLDPADTLGDDKRAKVDSGKIVDVRVPWLAKVSGKGGYHVDPKIAINWAVSANISLLDHLTSVARGAGVFAVMLGEAIQASPKNLEQRAVWALTLGFLHDANKILDVISPLPNGAWRDLNSTNPDELQKLWSKLGLKAWFINRGIMSSSLQQRAQEVGQDPWLLLATWILPCLTLSECVAADTVRGGYVIDALSQHSSTLSVNELMTIANQSVRWADRMEGAWLKKGVYGLQESLKELRNSDHQSLAAIMPDWEVITLFDPLHPFILDRLLLTLEEACQQHTGWLPLIGTHHDGELVITLPRDQRDAIVYDALQVLGDDVTFGLDILLNNKMALSIVNDVPSWSSLVDYWREQLQKGVAGRDKVAKLMSVHKNALDDAAWDDLIQQAEAASPGAGWQWVRREQKDLGQYDRLLSSLDLDLQNNEEFRDHVLAPALATIVVLAFPDALGAKQKALSREQRLQAWSSHAQELGVANEHLYPSIKDPLSRAVLVTIGTVLHAVPNTLHGQPLNDRLALLFAPVEDWWEGSAPDAQDGLKKTLPFPKNVSLKKALTSRYGALLNHQPVLVDEQGPYRCLFSGEPIAADQPSISSENQLYGVKMSAFNGRSGRPDNLIGAPSSPENYVSPVSEIEHRLRTQENPSGRDDGVAIYVASPMRTGLFASIRPSINGTTLLPWVQRLKASQSKNPSAQKHLSTFRLLKEENKDQDALSMSDVVVTALGLEDARLGRYESLPSKVGSEGGQIDFFLRWLKASLRFNRPVHLFRGLPSPRKEFFYTDCLPPVLARFWDASGLRLEQIPLHIRRTEVLNEIIVTKGLGWGFAEQFSQRSSRWSMAAFLVSTEKLSFSTTIHLRSMMNTIQPNPSEALLVQMCVAAAKFQKGISRSASNSEKSMAWDLAWDAFTVYRALPVAATPIVDLALAVVGKIEEDMGRRGNLLNGAASLEARGRFAEIFVQLVGMFQNRRPSQDVIRVLTGAYRTQFLLECDKNYIRRNAPTSGLGLVEDLSEIA